MLITTLICAVALRQGPPPPVRLLTLLPNGASLLVERVESATTASIQLFCSSVGSRDTTATHGARHLLEHLLSKSADPSNTLELSGGVFRAQTTRDYMQFEVEVPASQIQIGIDAISRTMRMPVVSQETITKESKIIGEELALADSKAEASQLAWEEFLGEAALSPGGDAKKMIKLEPEQLYRVHKTQFASNHIALIVVGHVDVDQVTKQLAPMLKVLSEDKRPSTPRTFDGLYLRRRQGVLSVGVGSVRQTSTLAMVAAALALANELNGGYFVYTPSAESGVVTVGCDNPEALDAVLKSTDAPFVFVPGKNLARQYFESQLRTPEGIASLRGSLLVQSPSLKPEILISPLKSLTFKDFQEAWVKLGGRP